MKEISAQEITEAYNKKFKPKITIEQTREYLKQNAFFAMKPELAASIMHKALKGDR